MPGRADALDLDDSDPGEDIVMSRNRVLWVRDWVGPALMAGLALSTTPDRLLAQEPIETAPVVEGPQPREVPPDPPRPVDTALDPAPDENAGPLIHEAAVAGAASAVPLVAPKAPPQPLRERPNVAQPERAAVWVPGYWTYEAGPARFAWVAGTWRVPPPGTFWVAGTWRRDAGGWTRSPGFWSDRRAAVAEVAAGDWRLNGPPADHPVDKPGPPPSPSALYVPGHYEPNRAGALGWVGGRWMEARDDQDFVPPRWVRRADGWAFRTGYWTQDPNAVTTRSTARPRVGDEPVAPGIGTFPPPIVDSRPLGADNAGDVADRPLGEPVDRPVVTPVGPPFVVAPGYVAGPYPVGPYPYYSPRAAVNANPYIPPFARRILNRVLP